MTLKLEEAENFWKFITYSGQWGSVHTRITDPTQTNIVNTYLS